MSGERAPVPRLVWGACHRTVLLSTGGRRDVVARRGLRRNSGIDGRSSRGSSAGAAGARVRTLRAVSTTRRALTPRCRPQFARGVESTRARDRSTPAGLREGVAGAVLPGGPFPGTIAAGGGRPSRSIGAHREVHYKGRDPAPATMRRFHVALTCALPVRVVPAPRDFLRASTSTPPRRSRPRCAAARGRRCRDVPPGTTTTSSTRRATARPMTATHTDSLGELGNLQEHFSETYEGVALTLIDATSTLAVLATRRVAKRPLALLRSHRSGRLGQRVRVQHPSLAAFSPRTPRARRRGRSRRSLDGRWFRFGMTARYSDRVDSANGSSALDIGRACPARRNSATAFGLETTETAAAAGRSPWSSGCYRAHRRRSVRDCGEARGAGVRSMRAPGLVVGEHA